MSRTLLALLLAASVPCAGLAGEAAVAAADPDLARLQRETERLASLAGGTLGVGALHLETGRSVFVSGAERFPMASAYKVPIAVQLLSRVDGGEVRLDTMVTLSPSDLHPGSGMLSDLLDDPGVSLSLRNLLELMLLISDNSATDVVLRAAGGAEAVTRRMRALGVDGIRVERPTVELIADHLGITPPASSPLTMERYRELARGVTPEAAKAAAARFDSDPRDTATPEAMVALLAKIWRKQALTAESTDLLLDIMRRSQTGAGRIKGLLPPDTAVSHKTGTIGGTTNDVGIVTLPEGAGHVVTVVFVKGSDLDVEKRERAIAHVARAIYDYFLFNPVRR